MINQKQKTAKSIAVRQPRTRRQNLPTHHDDIFGLGFLPSPWYGGETIWAPAIDIVEKENKFVAKVELPGVHEEDVSVSIFGDMIIVEGEKEAESEVKKKGYSYRETTYGSFSRTIAIPSIVDIERINANFDKGVLEIDLPKIAGVKPQKVSVTTKKKAKVTDQAKKKTAKK